MSKYQCRITKSQIQILKVVYGLFETDNDDQSNDMEVPLPCHENQEFFKSGFNNLCDCIQSNIFNQDYATKTYRLPIPLLLDNQKEFYNLKQLTNDEVLTAVLQASLMMNMNKHEMIDWTDTQKHTVADNNSNDDNPKMVPLPLTHTQNANNKERTINEIKKYHAGLLQHMLQFFSCYDIHAFSSISNDFYQ